MLNSNYFDLIKNYRDATYSIIPGEKKDICLSVFLSAFSCSTHIKQVYINDGQYNQVDGNSVAEQKCEQHLILWSFSAIQAFEFLSFLFLLFCRQWKNLLIVSTYFMEGLVTSRLENTAER